jgi:transcriptional regulator with XRE-family HTH domain
MKISITIDVPNLEEVIKAERGKKEMSQNGLAFKMISQGTKITAQNIHRIESGETKILPYETLAQLCQGLGIDLTKELKAACLSQVPFLKN